MLREMFKYGVLLLLVVFLIVFSQRFNRWQAKIYMISTGKPSGGYAAFANQLTDLCGKHSLKLRPIESQGSIENMRRLKSSEADFALIQHGGEVSNSVRAVAEVYRDVVHILIANDSSLTALSDLKDKRIAIGLPNSGTQVVSRQLLGHYGFKDRDYKAHEWAPDLSVQGLINGDIDAMILVTELRAPIIEQAIQSGLIRHLSLGKANDPANPTHGISTRYRHLKPAVIPVHTYGSAKPSEQALPTEPVAALSLPSLLVCREDIPEGAVHALTKALHSNRSHFSINLPSEPSNLDQFPYPLHPGAEKYYRRKDPGFLVVYAEVIALLLSSAIAVVGVISGLRRWSSMRHKNRIDVYYAAVNDSWKRLQNDFIDDYEKEEQALINLRYKAFDELIAEKLTADESFRIFQDLLDQCLQELQTLKQQ